MVLATASQETVALDGYPLFVAAKAQGVVPGIHRPSDQIGHPLARRRGKHHAGPIAAVQVKSGHFGHRPDDRLIVGRVDVLPSAHLDVISLQVGGHLLPEGKEPRQFFQGKGSKVAIDPAWATVLLLIAVTFVGLDHFFGFSNSWMRFISAELKIKTNYESFQLNWQIKLAALEGETPSAEQAVELLNMCRDFLETINNILLEEMEEWKRNFKAALKKIDAETRNIRKI